MDYQEVKLLPINHTNEHVMEGEEIPTNILTIGTQFKWRKGFSGKGIVVALLDSGCDTNHPDLKERIIGGYNFTNECNGDINIYDDYNGHGTHIAGVIGGSINNTGLVGISPKVDLLILKVLNRQGTGTIDSLVEAIHYAIDWRGFNNEKVRVISLSLGLKNENKKLHKAIKRAIDHNISVVVSSGNDGDGDSSTNEYRYPGAYPEVVVVGAIDDEKDVAHFSNTNEYVDLYAPGVGIYSTYFNGNYKMLTGTSMSTAHVSGAIALLIEEYESQLVRTLTEVEVFQILMKHTSAISKEEHVIKVLDLSQNAIIDKRGVVDVGGK